MDKTNLALLKQAISEGLSESFDAISNSYSGEIVCSEKHRLAIRAIVYGKAAPKRLLSPRIRRVIAIFVAAALLLTGCGIAFRDEIRDVFLKLRGGDYIFVYPGYDENQLLEEVYEPSYIPEGYTLHQGFEPEEFNLGARYVYYDESGENSFIFDQEVISGIHAINSESVITKMYIYEYEIICADHNKQRYMYVWNDGKYHLSVSSPEELSKEELTLFIDGLVVKPIEQIENTTP